MDDAHVDAQGKWRDILIAFGVPARSLNGRHGPCPACGGKDRFRFDDREGKGTFFCSGCGAGDGYHLLQRVVGMAFKDAKQKISDIAGDIKITVRSKQMSDEQRRQMLREAWLATKPTAKGDVVDQYLISRNIDMDAFPGLRTGIVDGHPCMLAIVSNPAGKPISMHRTYLKADGSGKADIDTTRKLMPGSLEKGACIRLSDVGPVLGIAEGIETALAASCIHKIPVWSAINSTLLAQWTPPDGVGRIVVLGDNDAAFGGQAASYALAHRLACDGVDCDVRISPDLGSDWADIWRMA